MSMAGGVDPAVTVTDEVWRIYALLHPRSAQFPWLPLFGALLIGERPISNIAIPAKDRFMPSMGRKRFASRAASVYTLRELGPSQYQENLETLRTQVVNRPAEDGEPHQFVLLIAALPGIWDSPRTP